MAPRLRCVLLGALLRDFLVVVADPAVNQQAHWHLAPGAVRAEHLAQVLLEDAAGLGVVGVGDDHSGRHVCVCVCEVCVCGERRRSVTHTDPFSLHTETSLSLYTHSLSLYTDTQNQKKQKKQKNKKNKKKTRF